MQPAGISQCRKEPEEAAWKDGYLDDPDKLVVAHQTFAYGEKGLGTKTGSIDLPDMDAGIRLDMGFDEIAIAEIGRRGRQYPGIYQGSAIASVDPDRLDHFDRVSQLFQPAMQALFIAANVIRRHAGNKFDRIVQDKRDDSECIGDFFLLDIERTGQAFVGERMNCPVAAPCTKRKERGGKYERGRHGQPDKPKVLRACLHPGIPGEGS
ncbi:MAG: hypothetical protein U1E61_06715 [Bradyrhizobium sp.]